MQSNDDKMVEVMMGINDMSMSDIKEMACLGRLTKEVMPIVLDFVDTELRKGSNSSEVASALSMITPLFVTTALTFTKPGTKVYVAEQLMAIIAEDIIAMARKMENAKQSEA